MKSFVLASLLASATAFAPVSQQRATTSLNEFCNGYVGGDSVEPMWIGETGSKNFDPLGFTTVGLPNATSRVFVLVCRHTWSDS